MSRAPSDASALLEATSQFRIRSVAKKKQSVARVARESQFNFQLFFAAFGVAMLLIQLPPWYFDCEENQMSQDTPGPDATGRLTVRDQRKPVPPVTSN